MDWNDDKVKALMRSYGYQGPAHSIQIEGQYSKCAASVVRGHEIERQETLEHLEQLLKARDQSLKSCVDRPPEVKP